MIMPKDETVVLDIAGDWCRLFCDKPGNAARLVELGFAAEGGRWVRRIVDPVDRIALVDALIEMRALFSVGRDWSPAELVEYYREQGSVLKKFRTIAWTGPSEYKIVER